MNQIRTAVANAYPGDTWSRKVQKMNDPQVQAVYLRLKAKGKVS